MGSSFSHETCGTVVRPVSKPLLLKPEIILVASFFSNKPKAWWIMAGKCSQLPLVHLWFAAPHWLVIVWCRRALAWSGGSCGGPLRPCWNFEANYSLKLNSISTWIRVTQNLCDWAHAGAMKISCSGARIPPAHLLGLAELGLLFHVPHLGEFESSHDLPIHTPGPELLGLCFWAGTGSV